MSFFEAIEPVFNSYVLGNAPVKKLATGFDWVEGPVWFGDADCLLFSDIPNNRIMRWTRCRDINLSHALELCERPHSRQARALNQLRARHKAGDANRTGWVDHDTCGQF